MKKKLTMLLGGMILAAAMGITTYASQSGWTQVDNKWHYVNQDGSYHTGWLDVNGVWYYMDENGIMLADTTTPDGYYVDASGALAQNDNVQGVSVNRDFEKYYNYTNAQLASEFNFKVVSQSTSQWGDETMTVYYDGEISENGYYVSKENPAANTIIISVWEKDSADYGFDRSVQVSLRTSRLVNGVTNDSSLEDILTIGTPEYSMEYDEFHILIPRDNEGVYQLEFAGTIFSDIETEQQFIRDIDYNLLNQITESSTDWNNAWGRALEHLKTRKIDTNSYVNVTKL